MLSPVQVACQYQADLEPSQAGLGRPRSVTVAGLDSALPDSDTEVRPGGPAGGCHGLASHGGVS